MADEKAEQFGKRLQALRKEVGFTQQRLAEEAEFSTEFISRIERGVNSPSVKSLERIAEVMKVDVRRFFDGPENPENWEVEIDSITVVLRSKSGRKVTKEFRLAEVKPD